MAAKATVRMTPRDARAVGAPEQGPMLFTTGLIAEFATRAEEAALLDEMNEHYAALSRDPEAWREFASEREAWEATLLDSLGREG